MHCSAPSSLHFILHNILFYRPRTVYLGLLRAQTLYANYSFYLSNICWAFLATLFLFLGHSWLLSSVFDTRLEYLTNTQKSITSSIQEKLVLLPFSVL
jgi:hypothetical protein